jgi:hypothetical protein
MLRRCNRLHDVTAPILTSTNVKSQSDNTRCSQELARINRNDSIKGRPGKEACQIRRQATFAYFVLTVAKHNKLQLGVEFRTPMGEYNAPDHHPLTHLGNVSLLKPFLRLVLLTMIQNYNQLDFSTLSLESMAV